MESQHNTFDMDAQIELIENIREKITLAAVKVSKKPPKFVLSVLFIPNWEREGNSYTDTTYNETKKTFFRKFSSKIDQKNRSEIDGFQLKDAYEGTSEEEKKYLYKLKNKGANADWNKTNALILNKEHKHLQLDSNTQIISYDNFYAQTFGQDQGFDGLNASSYDENTPYVSPHNKVVYTMPGSKLVNVLAKVFSKYCSEHQEPNDPDKDNNSIYSKVFCPSLEEIDLVDVIKIPSSSNEESKKRYLVKFDKPEYRLTKDIITAVNKSWDDNLDLDPYADIKNVKPLKYKDAEITFTCFLNLIRAHGEFFRWHKDHDLLIFRNQLHNRTQDIEIIKKYYEYIKSQHPDLLINLANVFTATKEGEKLCSEAFSCNINQLKESSNKRRSGELLNHQHLRPGYQHFRPGYQHPHPGYQYPHPGYQYPHPGYQHPHPGYQYPHPGYQYPHPGYQYPHPGYQHPHPGYQHPHPGYQYPHPGYI